MIAAYNYLIYGTGVAKREANLDIALQSARDIVEDSGGFVGVYKQVATVSAQSAVTMLDQENKKAKK